MTNSIDPTTLVDDACLAALVGVSARRIRQLTEAGELTRHGRNTFQLGPALRALLDHAAGDGANGELQRERVRATRAAADLREIEVAKARAEVASVAVFEAVQSSTATLIRVNMLRIPQRAASRLLGEQNETTFKRILQEEIVLALHTARDEIVSRKTEDIAKLMNQPRSESDDEE